MVQPDKIVRSDRKTLSISVDCFGRLIVRAPRRCSEEKIASFLREKEGWILRHQAKKAGAGESLPPENLDGFSFLLLGKPHVVRLWEGKKISYDQQNFQLFVPRDNPHGRVTKWLKENAKRIFLKLATERAKEIGVSFPSLTVNSASSRWGSCSYNGALHFSFRLIYAPREMIDYVVVHELSHILHHNHSAAFWAAVERVLPDYRPKRAWIKDRGYLLHIF